jgi:hypothetical protein
MMVDNLKRVQQGIVDACARVNRDPATVTLIAVSKTHPPERVMEAIQAGLQHFGENRVEEAEFKIPAVHRQMSTRVTWHMVGHLQSRKAKDAVSLFQIIHSVDSLKLATKLSRLSAESGKRLDILLEMNVSGEETKYGFQASNWDKRAEARDQLWQSLDSLWGLPGLAIRGLMTMAPIADNPENARPVFASLAALKIVLEERFNLVLPTLSMGMTDDYKVAIEEGATMIRIGRAIFGDRH